MSSAQIVILAVIQGIAEFLPVSSSGHLVIVADLLSQNGNKPDFDVADVTIFLHAGTLGSILVFYWNRVLMLLREDRRTIPLLIVGTIPAVVAGLIIKKMFDEILLNSLLAGSMLVITGVILLIASRFRHRDGTYQELSYARAVGIGMAQAFAILPGISRSGSTIVAGMANGLSRRDSATFSFLLAIPVIAGAMLLETVDIFMDAQMSTSVPKLLLGAAVSFVVGLFALWLLLRTLERGRLEWFAYWCFPVGIGAVIWQLMT